MKKINLLFLFLCVSLIGFAQQGKNQLSFGPEINIPAGNFADAYKMGFGGTIKGLYGIGSSGQLTLMLGYSSFKGKSGSSGGYSYSDQTLNIIPYLLGYRQNLKSIYIEPEVGFATYATKISSFKETETRLTYALALGYALQHFDLGLRYQSHVGMSLLAVRLAYVLAFEKMKAK
jgi:hypothetical protein